MYYEIASYFNKKISGKFPFCKIDKHNLNYAEELNFQEFTKFIELINKYKEIFDIVERDEKIEITDEMRFFISKLRMIYNIFKINKNGGIYVDGKVIFRPNKRIERHTKYISNIRYTVENTLEGNKYINIYDDDNSFVWCENSTVKISVKLSEEYSFRFRTSKSKHNNTLQKIAFNGPWSLIKMILSNQENGYIKVEMPVINTRNKGFDKIVFAVEIVLSENLTNIFPEKAPNYAENIDIDIDEILAQ